MVVMFYFLENIFRAAKHVFLGPDLMTVQAIIWTTTGGLQGDGIFNHAQTDVAVVFLVTDQRTVRYQ